MAVCPHCDSEPVVRTVDTGLPGTSPVNLGLCQCDWLRCKVESCREILRELPIGQNTCPACKTLL